MSRREPGTLQEAVIQSLLRLGSEATVNEIVQESGLSYNGVKDALYALFSLRAVDRHPSPMTLGWHRESIKWRVISRWYLQDHLEDAQIRLHGS